MSSMYGGDEVNALVLDLGSYSFKAGYSGDDTPKAVFPSMVGIHDAPGFNGMDVDGSTPGAAKLSVGYQALSGKQLGVEVRSPFGPDDLYADWDLVEALYGHAIKDSLGVKAEDFALLISEPSHNSRAAREQLTEYVFETLSAPALFLGRAAMLSAFATARQSALVLDCGYRAATAAAVVDGYVLRHSVCRTPLGGQLLNAAAQSVADAKYCPLRPRWGVRRQEVKPGEFQVVAQDLTGVTTSYRAYGTEQVASELKEGVARCSEGRFVEAEGVAVPTVVYELPDGQELYLGAERFRTTELLFQPHAFISHFPGLKLAADVRSVPGVALDAVNKCDVDLRKDMYSGVVLTGGTSLIPGFKERLEKELSDLSPPAAKVKMMAASNTIERRFSTWIGGSILSSLGTFQQLWMSKKEYGEHGAPLINRKCP